MYSFEWMIGVALVALAGGLGLGALLGRSMGDSRKVQSLQEELEAAQQAHSSYRSDVYDQFAETARKFERMNESYSELHQQLASSAALLLGDSVGTPLLAGPRAASVIDAEVAAAASSTATVDTVEESGEIRSAMGASIDPLPEPAAESAPKSAAEPVAETITETRAESGPAAASADDANSPPTAEPAPSQLKA